MTGRYFVKGRPVETSALARGTRGGGWFWTLSEELTQA
jgi:hypothetical protein